MEYVSLVLAILTFLLAVGILIFVIKNKNQKVDNSLNQMELGKIMHQIDTLQTNLQKDIEIAVGKEMIKIMESDSKAQELNNEKLERFQKNIVESLNARFEFINNQINEKMAEINKKVEEKMQAGFESTTETMTQVRERLKVIDEAQKNIESLSKDVVSLRNIMEGNQTRGQYGEYQLSMVLHNVFGDTVGCYQEQYTIKRSKDGDDVRAEIGRAHV